MTFRATVKSVSPDATTFTTTPIQRMKDGIPVLVHHIAPNDTLTVTILPGWEADKVFKAHLAHCKICSTIAKQKGALATALQVTKPTMQIEGVRGDGIKQTIGKVIFLALTAIVSLAFVLESWIRGTPIQQLAVTPKGNQMFDPLTAVLVYLFTEGFKYFTKFLNDHGFPLVVNDWGTLALAIVTAIILVLNQFGGGLSPDVARWIPVLVTIILDVLGAIGIKATIKAVKA
jgi:hypothetical protein